MSSSARRSATGPAPDQAARRAAALTAVLDRLDQQDDKRFRNRRAGDRIRYRCIGVPARIAHPGGSRSTVNVATRNISTSGIGLVTPGFLHLGTRIELVLHRLVDRMPDVIHGTVVFCHHVGGTMHQVGVRFQEKLFVGLYVDVPVTVAAAD